MRRTREVEAQVYATQVKAISTSELVSITLNTPSTQSNVSVITPETIAACTPTHAGRVGGPAGSVGAPGSPLELSGGVAHMMKGPHKVNNNIAENLSYVTRSEPSAQLASGPCSPCRADTGPNASMDLGRSLLESSPPPPRDPTIPLAPIPTPTSSPSSSPNPNPFPTLTLILGRFN